MSAKASSKIVDVVGAPVFTHGIRTVRLGLRSLWQHRLRSLLTVLGIVFGVSSVIAMLAVGEGVSHEAQEQIRRLGSNNVILRSLKPPDEQKNSSSHSHVAEFGLKYEDISIIRGTIPGISVVVPGRIIRNYVWRLNRRTDCDITGTVPWYPEMRNATVAQGRFFTEAEVHESTNVCVLGAEMVDTLFPIDSPLEKTVRVGSDYYRVVGVMAPDVSSDKPESGPETGSAPPAKNAPSAQSAGVRMFIPLTSAKNRIGETVLKRRSGSFEAEKVELHEAIIKVKNQDAVEEVSLIVGDIMERTHKKKDYEIIVPLELLQQAEKTKRMFNIVLGAIAAISLLVGGIGIMNIMLATVSERTREIGIRRALGAKRRDIIWQFLIETVILSATGGILGVALGVAVPFCITWFSGMLTIITPWSPLLAFSISALIGVVFGIYPALRAANMDPVEALRHE